MNFTGKVVLVTGGSRGIGSAVATAFADRGARVAVSYLSNKTAAEEAIAGMPGGPHLAIQADVTDAGSVQRMITAVVETTGGLDIVVNNAGIWVAHPPDDIDFDGWRDAWRSTIDTK
jgi:NAD(P)-dependent dehydrogenase (short-subunit alcohol dehydrogenase family)